MRAVLLALALCAAITACSSSVGGSGSPGSPTAGAPSSSTGSVTSPAPSSTAPSSSSPSSSSAPSTSAAPPTDHGVPIAEFVTPADLGAGYKYLPNAKKSSKNTGKNAVTLGCLDISKAYNEKSHTIKAAALRQYQVSGSPATFLEAVIDMKSVAAAQTLAKAIERHYDACTHPAVHIFQLDFTISSNHGTHGLPGCQDGATYAASFIHQAQGGDASKVIYFEFQTYVVRQDSHVAYGLALNSISSANPISNAVLGTKMCSHLG